MQSGGQHAFGWRTIRMICEGVVGLHSGLFSFQMSPTETSSVHLWSPLRE